MDKNKYKGKAQAPMVVQVRFHLLGVFRGGTLVGQNMLICGPKRHWSDWPDSRACKAMYDIQRQKIYV